MTEARRGGEKASGRKESGRKASVEQQVRQRVAEALLSGGVGKDRVALEVLYLLPPDFVDTYVGLYEKALDMRLSSEKGMRRIAEEGRAGVGEGYRGGERGASGGGRDQEKGGRTGRRSRGKGGVVGGGNRKVKVYREHWLIRDSRAFEQKKKVDARLRKLAREIRQEWREEYSGGVGEGSERVRGRRRCRGCGRWVEEGWRYCSFCGDRIK